MKTVDVYERYFEADLTYNGVKRRAASVKLTAESDSGMIKYEVSVSFFPHEEPEDFRISYDAYFSTVLYHGKGRRSKKKEEEYMKILFEKADALAEEQGGRIFWDKPLIEERRG
ncbi:MAG: hypothetical protein II135_05610 [Clostridia bacterium]|nr:hypothetical protein [Clostridia bacterium]